MQIQRPRTRNTENVAYENRMRKTMRFIGVEVEQETSAPPPKKNPGPAPEYCPCKKKEKRDLGAVVTCCNPLPRTINQAEHPA